MLSKSNYKKTSKVNIKRKEPKEDEQGMLVNANSRKRFPVVSLPMIPTVHIDQVYRRIVNNGGAISGTMAIFDLLKQFTVATTAVLGVSFVRCVRIKKIRCLAPVTTQGTSVTLKLKPSGSDTSDNNFNSVNETYIDTSASIDIPAYISLSPSLDTPLGSWHQNINVDGLLLNISAPPGTTMDILFEYILSADTPISAYSRVLAGATIGTLYAGPILTNFLPQGVNSI